LRSRVGNTIVEWATVPDTPVPILDLTRYDEDLRSEIGTRVAEVFASGRLVLAALHRQT